MNFGWIEIVLFYGIAIGVGAWQYVKMDRMLKATRAEKAAKEATQRESDSAQSVFQPVQSPGGSKNAQNPTNRAVDLMQSDRKPL
jgi:hypothetical protein